MRKILKQGFFYGPNGRKYEIVAHTEEYTVYRWLYEEDYIYGVDSTFSFNHCIKWRIYSANPIIKDETK